MADPNYGQGRRDRHGRGRDFSRQEEQFDTGDYSWSDDEARLGQMGDSWQGRGYDDFDFEDRQAGRRHRSEWGRDPSQSHAGQGGAPRSYWRSWRDREGPSYGSFRGDDFGGHDFGTAQFTNRGPQPGQFGAGSRLAANHGKWRPVGAAPSGSYANDREWRGDRDERSWLDRASDAVSEWFGGDDDDDHRQARGYRGHGPSGYTRPDQRILEDACDALTQDWGVDARQVSVTVSDGEVTLDGTVPSRQQKRRAEDCVHDVSGVKHVQNNLRVQPSQAWDRSDKRQTASGEGSSDTL